MAHLERQLGLLGLTATGICAMMGAAINIIPIALQRNVPGIGGYVLWAYVLAAVPAILAAFAYAALASAIAVRVAANVLAVLTDKDESAFSKQLTYAWLAANAAVLYGLVVTKADWAMTYGIPVLAGLAGGIERAEPLPPKRAGGGSSQLDHEVP